MAKILIAWELGGGLGHMARALPLALALRAAGHEIAFALRDLSRAESMLGQHGFSFFQAPIWLPQLSGAPPAVSYPEILFQAGYLDTNGLIGLVKGWHALVDTIRPDLLLLDHAPTALLAARGKAIKKVLIGNGFFVPPRETPMPAFRTWLTIEPQRLAASEALALQRANHVLERLVAPKLGMLAELFDVDENLLYTWPELDHYPQRKGARYWGPAYSLDNGAAPHWPAGQGKQVFAYLKTDYRYLETLLQALRTAPCRVLAYVSGANAALINKYQSASCTIVAEPINMEAARQAADVIVCHAGSGTIAAALHAGKPLLLAPTFAEAYMLAESVARLGAGINVPLSENPDFARALQRMLQESTFAEYARAFAHKYRDFSQPVQIAQSVARIEEILRAPAVP